jgi:hypothetical protein
VTPLLTRAFTAKLDDASEADRTITAVVTTDAVDRSGEVVVAGGLDLAEYNKNRIVLWMHGKDPNVGVMPIGKALWIKLKGNRRELVAKTKFAPTELGETMYQLYEGEFLKMWSIGAEPDLMAAGPPTKAEIRKSPEWVGVKKVWRKATLREYSAAHIGVNPEALTLVAEKGLYLPESLTKAWTPDAPLPAPTPEHTPDPLDLDWSGRRFGDVQVAYQKAIDAKMARLCRSLDARLDLARGQV